MSKVEKEPRQRFIDRKIFRGTVLSIGALAFASMLVGMGFITERSENYEQAATDGKRSAQEAILALTGTELVGNNTENSAFIFDFTDKDTFAVQVRKPDEPKARELLGNAVSQLEGVATNEQAHSRLSEIYNSEQQLTASELVHAYNSINVDISNGQAMTNSEDNIGAALFLTSIACGLISVIPRKEFEHHSSTNASVATA